MSVAGRARRSALLHRERRHARTGGALQAVGPGLGRRAGHGELGASTAVLVDPNLLDADGTTAITVFEPDDTGDRVVYGLSRHGSDVQELLIHDVATGAPLADRLQWVKFASIAWWGDGFFYTRYPQPGTVPPEQEQYFCQVWFHRVGDPQAADRLVHHRPDAPEVVFDVDVTSDDRHLVIASYRGASDNAEIHVVRLGAAVRRRGRDRGTRPLVTGFSSGWHFIDGARRLAVLPHRRRRAVRPHRALRSRRRDAPRRTIVVAESRDTIVDAAVADGRLLVSSLQQRQQPPDDLVARRRRRARRSRCRASARSSASARGGPTRDRSRRSRRSRRRRRSWRAAPDALDADPARARCRSIRRSTSPNRCGIRRRTARRSRCSWSRKRGRRRRRTPSLARAVLLDRLRRLQHQPDAGVRSVGLPLARRGRRAGGRATCAAAASTATRGTAPACASGSRTCSTTSSPPPSGCSRRGRAAPGRVAIEGGSNGGLLVGACLVQRPDLFGAAICRVPVADMLRYHLFTVGRFWIPEYGCADERRRLSRSCSRYSPYHNVVDGAAYPPTLVMTADTDDRVAPGMAKKFAARLQEASRRRRRADSAARRNARRPRRGQADRKADRRAG